MALETKTVVSTGDAIGSAAALFSSTKKVRAVILEPEHDNAAQVFVTLPDEDGTDTLAFVLAQPNAATDPLDRITLPGPEVPVQDGIDLSTVKVYAANSADGVRVTYYE